MFCRNIPSISTSFVAIQPLRSFSYSFPIFSAIQKKNCFGRTDRPSYRDAWTHLKTDFVIYRGHCLKILFRPHELCTFGQRCVWIGHFSTSINVYIGIALTHDIDPSMSHRWLLFLRQNRCSSVLLLNSVYQWLIMWPVTRVRSVTLNLCILWPSSFSLVFSRMHATL